MCTERVLPEEKRPDATPVTVPAVYIKAAVSPTILPTPSITPARIPGTADGRTIRKTVLSLPAPNPKLPSLKRIRHSFQSFFCRSHNQRQYHDCQCQCARHNRITPFESHDKHQVTKKSIYDGRNS